MPTNPQVAAGGTGALPSPSTLNLPTEGQVFTSNNNFYPTAYTIKNGQVQQLTQNTTNANTDLRMPDGTIIKSGTYGPAGGWGNSQPVNPNFSGASWSNSYSTPGYDSASIAQLPYFNLADVSQYIQKNGSLPNTPTATINATTGAQPNPTDIAAASAAQTQQLAGTQNKNVQTTTDNQGNITSSQATPLAQGVQTAPPINPFAIPMGNGTPGGYVATQGATLDQLKQQLVQASGQLTQMQIAQETPASIANKYNQAFNSVKDKTSPSSQGEASQTIQGATGVNSGPANPVVSSYGSSLTGIMGQFQQILSNISNPSLAATSLQTQYDQLSQQYNLPAMKTEMVNMQNIMNGTIDDVRNEVTKAGGFATESQVQGIAAARNRTMLLQYNALSNNYTAAETNVSNMMQFAASDRSAQLQAEQLQESVISSMASVQNQMTQMAMTMQNNARSAAQFNVSQMGYQALAQSIGNDPQMQSSYENLLGLAPGTLSNPQSLAAMDTYKNQQLQLNNYKAAIAAYNAGYSSPSPLGTSSGGSTGQYGTATSTVSQMTGYDPNIALSQVDLSTLTQAMIQNEGSSPAGVSNNPGNIKFAGLPGQTNSGVQASDGGTFASYATPAAGQAAITSNIQNAIKTNPNQTLGAFVDRYTNTAPQNNSPQGQIGITPIDPTTLVRPSFVDNGVPLTMSAQQMEQYMSVQKSAAVDPGTNNIVAPGVGYYLHQSDGSYVLNSALPSPIDQQYNEIKQTIANTPAQSLSPTVTRKWSLTANAGISSFKNTGTYQVISNAAPYLANIRAAADNPGDKSVSDLELLDSYIRLSKGGVGQITGDQVDILLKGSSLADSASVLEQKLQQGGSLSPSQRSALIGLASNVYKENASDYEKIYVQAIQNLKSQGVPTQFWGNLPDFTSLMTQ